MKIARRRWGFNHRRLGKYSGILTRYFVANKMSKGMGSPVNITAHVEE